jgi:hypothetical protein
MSEKSSEKSEMSTVEFVQDSLRKRVAPVGSAQSVKARVGLAARRLGWSYSRTKDAWYAARGVSINGNELHEIEEYTGVRYGRQEVREIDEIIARAGAFLDGPDADFYRPFITALREMVRAVDRTRIGE